MQRFLAVLTLLFVCAAPLVCAAEKLSPPLEGDMARLEVFDNPEVLPKVMLSSADKGLVYLSEYRGKLVLLNLWATWCPPCIEELPSLNALQRALGGGHFDVVTVSVDASEPGVIKKYLDDHKLDMLPGFRDVNNDVQKLNILKGSAGIPITLIIDPQNRVLARYQGNADWSNRETRAVLEYYMSKVSFIPML